MAKRIANAAFGYAGQSCISVQNVAVEESISQEFFSHLRNTTTGIPFGDPKNSSVSCGPLIRKEAAQRVSHALTHLSSEDEVILSRKKEGHSSPKTLQTPTLVITEDDAKIPGLVQEEIFAPVMIARSYSDLDSLISQINQGKYGLQAGVYCQDFEIIDKCYRELEVGGVVINDVPTSRYDQQPYGGVKESGTGREGVRYAMEDMTYLKFLALSSQVPV